MGWPAEHAAWAAAGIHGAIFVPLTSLPMAAWLWYQGARLALRRFHGADQTADSLCPNAGESDTGQQCGAPDCGTYYADCFPAMIEAWRDQY